MLIKIGNALVDPNEIAVIQPDRNERLSDYDKSTHILIELRNGGSIWIEASMDEAEAALIDAGVVTDLIADPDPVPPLTDAEVGRLCALDRDGYRYLARDKDGKLYAFRQKPVFKGFYWEESGPVSYNALQVGEDFAFINWDDAEPTEIEQFLKDPF